MRSRIDGELTAILFREGQEVKSGDVLAQIDPRPLQAQLEQLEAIRAKNQALLDAALLDLQRSESLASKSIASQQQLDQHRAVVAQHRAQIRSDEAQIAFARNQLAYTTVTSPISGRAGIRLVDQGNYLRSADSTPIVVLNQVQPISVVFTLPATTVAQSRLTLGELQAPVDAYAADGRTVLDRGTVHLVDNQIDQSTGTIKLKAVFRNTALKLWPGGFVNGRIVVDTRKKGTTVPIAAVRHGPRGDFVFVLRADQTVEVRDVTTGQQAGQRVLIERNLKPGEVVVTDGHFRLENGTAVKVRQAVPAEAGEGAESSRTREPS